MREMMVQTGSIVRWDCPCINSRKDLFETLDETLNEFILIFRYLRYVEILLEIYRVTN